MSLDVYRRIIDEGVEQGLCALKLQSRGESLIHPDILECVAYAKEKGVLDVHITTNGLLLSDEMARGLVENGLDLLVLSYDDFHMNASSMGEDEYTIFMQKISKKVNSFRNQNRKSNLKIRLQSCIHKYTPDNIAKEEDRINKLFPEADFVLINPVYESYADRPRPPE